MTQIRIFMVALVLLAGGGVLGRDSVAPVQSSVRLAASEMLSLSDFCHGGDDIDDTECLQQWLNAGRRLGKSDLYVPPGVYFYSGTITLYSGIHLHCASPGSSIFQRKAGPGSLFTAPRVAGRDEYEGLHDVTIENCGFDVNGGPDPFLFVINIAGSTPSSNILIRSNRIFDSALPDTAYPKEQRQYILLLNCDYCRVEQNDLSGGGRIKVGRPGKQLFINRNTLRRVNDNAITVVDITNTTVPVTTTTPISLTTSRNIIIEDNVIADPISTGIFFGVDGEGETHPALATFDVRIAGNIISGDWEGSCIRGTLPAHAAKIHVVDNICTKTGSGAKRGRSLEGIIVRRVNETRVPASDVLIGFNTIVLDVDLSNPERPDPPRAIFVSGPFDGVRITGNQVRGVMDHALWARISVEDALVSDNLFVGGNVRIDNGFSGTIQQNIIADAKGPAVALSAGTAITMTASIKDNIIRDSTGECVQFNGAGVYQVDLVGNQFMRCGGRTPVTFIAGATLAAGSLRVDNQGDGEPHATVTRQLTGTTNWGPLTLEQGQTVGTDVEVIGACLGDMVAAGFDSLGVGNWHISAHVNRQNQVRVVVTNQTGASVNLPNGQLRVVVWKVESARVGTSPSSCGNT